MGDGHVADDAYQPQFNYLCSMCGRFNQELIPDNTLKFLKPRVKDNPSPKRIVNVGGNAKIIHGEEAVLTDMLFGFNKRVNMVERYMFNARAEGSFNKDNHRDYTGQLGIQQNGWAMEGFYSHRALVPVTSFVEGPEKKRLKKPYDVGLKDVQQFYLAAIVDTDFKTGKLGFCILTCWPNELIETVIGHHRLPVILEEQSLAAWLNPDTLIDELLPMLKPYPSELMEIEPLFTENNEQLNLL